jgi:hypothetical protein
VLVNGGQGATELPDDASRALKAQRTPVQSCAERNAVDELHDEERLATGQLTFV